MTGVGMKVANNEIYNAPHSAIMYTGNEHIIEYNYIHDVVCETSDSGAVYAGQDFLGHGSVIRYNYFENIDSADKAYFLGFIAADGNVFKRENKIVDSIGKYSFGIYILHPLWLNILNKGFNIYPNIWKLLIKKLTFAG